MNCLTISSARALSLAVEVGNSGGNDVGGGVAGVVVDGFCAGVYSS